MRPLIHCARLDWNNILVCHEYQRIEARILPLPGEEQAVLVHPFLSRACTVGWASTRYASNGSKAAQ